MNNIIMPLLTVLASGITAAIVTHVLNSRKEEKLLIRQKLEELHLAFHKYIIGMSCSQLPFLRAMEGTLDYNQALDQQIKSADNRDPEAFPTVERIIGIYFPDLESDLKVLLDCRDKLNELKQTFRDDYQKGITSCGPWMEPFRQELIRVDTLSKELKRKIVKHPMKTTIRMPTRR